MYSGDIFGGYLIYSVVIWYIRGLFGMFEALPVALAHPGWHVGVEVVCWEKSLLLPLLMGICSGFIWALKDVFGVYLGVKGYIWGFFGR